MKKLSIIIPAYNEQERIGATLSAYHTFLSNHLQNSDMEFELVVALNGCCDNTIGVVNEYQQKFGNIVILDLPQSGKGYAIIEGFLDALRRENDVIGFVDADMATKPEHFFALVEQLSDNDGTIASRYMPNAQVYPPRPRYKRWGSALIYETLIRLLFGLRYYDYQCGAKVFQRRVLEKIAPFLTEQRWAFDVELLYLCKKNGFCVVELPTVWHDQSGSKLTLRAGFRMLSSLVRLRLHHSQLYKRFFA